VGAAAGCLRLVRACGLYEQARRSRAGMKNSLERADSDGLTALMLASRQGDADVVEELLEMGADVAAVVAEDPDDAFEKKVGWSSLHFGSRGGHEAAVRCLLEWKARVDRRTGDGCRLTSLILASKAGEAGVVEVLLEAKADADAVDFGGSGSLHWASERGHGGVVGRLLSAKADVDGANQEDGTALMCASVSGNSAAAGLLLSAQADVNARDMNGDSAVFFASSGGHLSCLELLLSVNADVRARNVFGDSCLSVALRRRHWLCALRLARVVEDNEASEDEKALLARKREEIRNVQEAVWDGSYGLIWDVSGIVSEYCMGGE
jgi:ankyrin repeat protein